MQKEIKNRVRVIGAGLAGSEAAYQLAKRGVSVTLYEMRPLRKSPVHETDLPAELVCSNSLGSDNPQSAPGMLKTEMKILGSLVMEAAEATRVPAGQAVAVDRIKMSQYILEKLQQFANLEIIRGEIEDIPADGLTIIATGPLTSPSLASSLSAILGQEYLYFYDAVSPTILTESINMDISFAASRYDKGTPDYLNCPMTKEEYENFYHELINGEKLEPEGFELGHFFEGCMPVEEIARRGPKTLVFGPLKPVGLSDRSEAVVQLRRENREGTIYSLVGFQTRLKWGEQKRIFRMIPGLEKAEFVRYGVMHKNIFVDAPRVLKPTLQLKTNPNIILAGQISGVEGYCESIAMGIIAGINASKIYNGENPIFPPLETAIGSLLNYITDESIKKIQPMNINFGILPETDIRGSKKDKRNQIVSQGVEILKIWQKSFS